MIISLAKLEIKLNSSNMISDIYEKVANILMVKDWIIFP